MNRRALRRPIAPLAAALSAALLLAPDQAAAQVTTFYLDRFQIAGAPEDSPGLWRPVFGTTRFYAQLGGGLSKNALRAEHLANSPEQAASLLGPPVAVQATGYITAGMELNERGAVQFTLPITVFQSGSPADNAATGLTRVISLAQTAPADMRIDARVLLTASDAGRLKVGARAAAFLPTGNARSFTGEGAVWGNMALSAELDFEKFFVTANAGASIRNKTTLNALTVGSELTYGLGVYMPLMHDRLRLGGELFGSAGLLSGSDGAPLEWSLNGRLFFNARHTGWLGAGAGTRITDGIAPDFRAVMLFGGAFVPAADKPVVERRPVPRVIPEPDTDKDGVPDVFDTCPEEPDDDFRPGDGCPEPVDIDHDGILNKADHCPDAAEDKDGIDDADGCPEDDADRDGFADAVDKCPKEPGVHNDDPEKEGCPKYIRKLVAEVALKREIEFETGKSAILERSYPILDELVKLLQVNPDIERLDIEGHTDNVGPATLNETLSNARAAAVRDYLVQKGGIAPTRLTSKGYGPSRPIASNDTPEGRARNRRVELHIIQQTTAESP